MKSRPLTPQEIEAFGAELDALHREVVGSLGEREAAYIRKVLAAVRYTEIGGRALLMLGWLPPLWLAGAGLLSFSKIAENMELGHNVMHGQYDWMNDPALRGDAYEWDNVCDGDQWRHYHNYVHHTYTNVRGVDRDIGYGLLRLFPEQRWRPSTLLQPLYAAALATFFQWGVGAHDLELEWAAEGKISWRDVAKKLPAFLKKSGRQVAKDYVVFPALAGPAFIPVIAGNATANLARNLWAFAIIFCGHFTEDAETFAPESLEGETRGQWYLRQIRGSGNLEGGPVMHFMSGNLSHQIEHHLFPDVPAVRYAEMGVKVREICERYGVNYNTGPFGKQLASVVKRIFTHALPTKPAGARQGEWEPRRRGEPANPARAAA